jgi:hypothetical protein
LRITPIATTQAARVIDIDRGCATA